MTQTETDNRIPLLLLSDAPCSTTGLGRITRDIARRAHEDAELSQVFRVATLGWGGPSTRHLPFHQYIISALQDWVVPQLPQVWHDFAGSQRGVVMTVWDPSRLTWFAQPAQAPRELQPFLAAPLFQRWGYFAVDSHGVGGKLPRVGPTLAAYDRVLAYSRYGEDVLRATVGSRVAERTGLTHLPHGLDAATWYPRDRRECRKEIRATGYGRLTDDALMVGIVATNQTRKDWALGIECVALLRDHYKAVGRDVCLWVHTDHQQRHWDIPAMLDGYGLMPQAVFTMPGLDDEQMARLYSACDLTLGIGLGEGFGYPIFESLACGVPCVHGNFAAAPQWLPLQMTVNPLRVRVDGAVGLHRPLFDASKWFQTAQDVLGMDTGLPIELNWEVLWPRWRKWLLAGVDGWRKWDREVAEMEAGEITSEEKEEIKVVKVGKL